MYVYVVCYQRRADSSSYKQVRWLEAECSAAASRASLPPRDLQYNESDGKLGELIKTACGENYICGVLGVLIRDP